MYWGRSAASRHEETRGRGEYWYKRSSAPMRKMPHEVRADDHLEDLTGQGEDLCTGLGSIYEQEHPF